MISAGDIVALTIDKPAAGGRMIARADGLVVLVSGTIPGERVRAKIERVAKGVAYAAAIDIEEPSSDRRTAGALLCGGCLYAHIVYARQLELKALVIADAFARIGRIALPASVQVAPSPEEGYRMRARLHVRGRMVGFFREGTHEICDARQTRQLMPATSDALDRLVAALHSLRRDGNAGELELAENVDASQRVVYLDLATPVEARSFERLAATDGLTGLASPGDVHGDVHVTDTIAIDGHPPLALRRHVLAFFQGNRYLVNQLAAHVVAQVPSGGDVIDLYAGIGVFAIAAAAMRGAQVKAVEGDRLAAADLAANTAATNGAVVPVHQSVEEFVGRAVDARGIRLPWPERQRRQPDRDQPGLTIIVDPPRTGISREAFDGIIQLRAPRIVYVSCDVATLARDARRLVENGYAVTQIDAFDLFPNTPHVETVVVFQNLRI